MYAHISIRTKLTVLFRTATWISQAFNSLRPCQVFPLGRLVLALWAASFSPSISSRRTSLHRRSKTNWGTHARLCEVALLLIKGGSVYKQTVYNMSFWFERKLCYVSWNKEKCQMEIWTNWRQEKLNRETLSTGVWFLRPLKVLALRKRLCGEFRSFQSKTRNIRKHLKHY